MSAIKTNIIEFTLTLVGRKSFSSFSYDDIAREFAMTKASVHYHFRSKEDLGVAVCETIREQLLASREEELAAVKSGRHPWKYVKSRIKSVDEGLICPIASLQADFENLPERLRVALAETAETEIENIVLLARGYDAGVDKKAVISLFLGLKGALLYRRVMGEKFFRKMLLRAKEQFYALMPERG